MIADKRSIAIKLLATDSADLEFEIFHFSTIFSFSANYFFSVIFFLDPRGIPELQKPITICEHQSWWTGRDLNPRPSGYPRRIFPMRTGRSTAQAAHDRPAYQAELPAQPNQRPAQKPSKRL